MFFCIEISIAKFLSMSSVVWFPCLFGWCVMVIFVFFFIFFPLEKSFLSCYLMLVAYTQMSQTVVAVM